MVNKNFILSLIILVIIIGCRPPTSSGGEGESKYRTGTQGLVMNFLSGAPPDKIYADAPYKVEIPISVEVRNKGAYPTEEGLWTGVDDVIYISGYDTKIIANWELNGNEVTDKLNGKYPYLDLGAKIEVLEGKNINNPEGGYDLLEFVGTADLSILDIEKYTPNFLVTACYDYETKASPNICIDPRPFTTVKERKVCNIQDITLSNQGAPVAITKVESKALSNSLQFKIHFKNIGKGDVVATDVLKKCSGKDGLGSLERSNMDFVKIKEVKVGDRSLIEEGGCGQLLYVQGYKQDEKHGDYARLINNEGFIVCNLKDYKKDVESAYTTPLYIELAYGYRDGISKAVEIIKVPEPK